MGKDRAVGRVGSGQTFGRQSRVGSGQRFAGSSRVQEKLPVDNSELTYMNFCPLIPVHCFGTVYDSLRLITTDKILGLI